MLFLCHAALYTPETRLNDAALLIDDGVIKKISTGESLACPLDALQVDARGGIVAPGFIDLQLNGAFGEDFTAHPDTIWQVAEQLPRFGVTSFLPTLVTCPLSQVDAAIETLKRRPPAFRGAEPLGLHVEGPFLNPQKKGAHNPAHLKKPDLSLVKDWSLLNRVHLVTLAPEMPGALEMVRELVKRGVIVSMGHTMATADQANAGYNSGIRYATHLFNAMPPLDHRAPGAAGVALSNPGWVTGLIPDGVHVHPAMVKAAWLAKGRDGMNLVTDAMAALGMPAGRYRLHDFQCIVSEQDARLEDGTLAGSILPMDRAVRNFIEFTECTLEDVLATVTTTPARLLKIDKQRGAIAEGMTADIVMLDKALNVKMTVAQGQVVYSTSPS